MKIQIITALLLSSVLAVSCKKEKNPSAESVTVYVAGMQWDSVTGNDRSGYWKNGNFSVNALPGNRSHYAHAIAVNGNDIYTTGYENQPSTWRCQVWKNGQHQYSLGDVYSYGNAVAIVGSDVYIGGELYEAPTHIATIWKNQTPLPPLGLMNFGTAVIRGAAASGTDVYMIGNIGSDGKLWKNATEMSLPNSAGTDLKAITVSGNDIYITGNVGVNKIRYWKNGSHTDITAPAGRQFFVSGIAVEGNDVYLSGWENTGTINIAKYWKNGLEAALGDGIRNSSAHAIAVKNGKVYVAGNLAAGSVSFIDYATVWENGVAKTIGLRNSRATAIAVK